MILENPDSKRSDVDVIVVDWEEPCERQVKSNPNVNKNAPTRVHGATGHVCARDSSYRARLSSSGVKPFQVA